MPAALTCVARTQGDTIYCVWRDATRHKHHQQALEDYLVTMSHDLFTPCHSIVSAAQLLAARDSVVQDAESAFFVQAIRSSAALMLGARCSWHVRQQQGPC
jgi:signal transduction histidine kinase